MPETLARLTVADAVRRSTELIARAGSDTARLDAEILVAEILQVGRERLIMDRERLLDADELAQLEGAVCRRCAREPVAYIIGRKNFRRLSLAVDQRVLIPRPETELVVEVGLTLRSGARVLDVGTGSGAVALALKDERGDLEVWATEPSADALAVAKANGERLGLEVRWQRADLLDGVPPGFDAIVANLPYVATGAALAPEISRYEPAAALFAGPDGLDVIRRLVAQADRIPLLALEVGFDQAPAVTGLLRAAGFASVEALRDLAGHDRVLVGRRE